MRISEEQTRHALDILCAAYGKQVPVWLFGSRVRDDLRGGDVDLFVQSDDADVLKRLRCKTRLTELFDLKVDLVVGLGDGPIQRIARQTGVRLQ